MLSVAFFFSGVVLGSIGAWLTVHHGHTWGLLDVPIARSSHARTTPKGGGIGILAAFLLACWVGKVPLTFWMPALAVALLGLASDRFDFKPHFRLFAHFLLAWSLLFFFFRYQGLAGGMIGLLALSVFVVGTANFYNFMDGINGIAAVSAIVAFGLLAWAGAAKGLGDGFVLVCLGITGACAGFLPFNFPSARVFMGDVGSLLLGFVFGAMVLWVSSDLIDIVCHASFLLPFYTDELNTMVVRLRDREKLWVAHRRHLYQLMANEAGIAHWKVALAYAVTQLAVGGGVLLFLGINRIVAFAVAVVGFVSLSLLHAVMHKRLSPCRTTQDA